MRLFPLIATSIALTFAAPAATVAQTYPDKLIRLVSPYAPGGGTDILARLIGRKLAENDGYHEAYWPRSARQMGLKPLARRLDTREGKTVAQRWDYLFRGDEVFALLEEGLKAAYPGVRFVNFREFGSTHSGDGKEVLAALPQRLKELGVDAEGSGRARKRFGREGDPVDGHARAAGGAGSDRGRQLNTATKGVTA